MDLFQNLTLKASDKVLTVWIDVQNSSVNIINGSLMNDLTLLVEYLREEKFDFIIFRSERDSGFLAGADVHAIQSLRTEQEVRRIIHTGQSLFNDISALKSITIAMISGPCLGGGLEFAMACDYRIAIDTPSTSIGLPETQLGLIPGWGGTQRLPGIVGVTRAVEMILKGKRLSAHEAYEYELIDRVCSSNEIEESLTDMVHHLCQGTFERRHTGTWRDWLVDQTAIGWRMVLKVARDRIRTQETHYPALPAAIRAIEAGLKHGYERGLQAEQDEFSKVVFSESAQNLINLFLNRERARKRETWVNVNSHQRPRKVGVVGAGVMGAGIGQAALMSGYEVILTDVKQEYVDRGRERIESLFRHAVAKNVVDQETANRKIKCLHTSTTNTSFADCDLIIEAILETMDAKQILFHELDTIVDADAVVASNTSALSVTDMSLEMHNPERIAGLHFFNPVHKMPLVEVVKTNETSAETLAHVIEFSRSLGKVPIVTSDSPGFLVNRILFPYLDEAVRLFSEGISVEEIDRAARRFGMPMGPMQLLDKVGLDVASHVASTLHLSGIANSPTPQLLTSMVNRGQLGEKSDLGFYHYQNGVRSHEIHSLDIESEARLPATKTLTGEEITGIQQRLIFPLFIAAIECLDQGVVAEPWMIDLGMVMGTGFAPFRGGPLSLMNQWTLRTVTDVMTELSETNGPRFEPPKLLRELTESGLDFNSWNKLDQRISI